MEFNKVPSLEYTKSHVPRNLTEQCQRHIVSGIFRAPAKVEDVGSDIKTAVEEERINERAGNGIKK